MLNDTLLHELNTSYSEALYGKPGRMPPLSELRVIWPHALSSEANASLAVALVCHPTGQTAFRLRSTVYPFVSNSFINHAAIWLHQPVSSFAAATSKSWVEVTHCAYRSRVEGTTRLSPLWFYQAPGSGVSVGVGRTLVITQDPRADRLRLALARGYINQQPVGSKRLPRVFGVDRILHFFGYNSTQEGEEVESVQFVHRKAASQLTGRFYLNDLPNTIVMLRWGREVDYLIQHLEHVRCGRSPHLRACRLGDVAIEGHGTGCMNPAMWRSLCTKTSVNRSWVKL